MEYTFTIEARDVPGMLVRMTQVFARRGYSISSLNVRPYQNDGYAIIDIIASNILTPQQLKYQLEKLVDINKVNVYAHQNKAVR